MRAFSARCPEIVQRTGQQGNVAGGIFTGNRLRWMSNRLRGDFVSESVAQQDNIHK
ncbi:hypothetical protein BN1182_BG_00400 [Pantoea ananatis]|nr:hypothetical protein BN1182_BG_00400 [Pantoea ananatis]